MKTTTMASQIRPLVTEDLDREVFGVGIALPRRDGSRSLTGDQRYEYNTRQSLDFVAPDGTTTRIVVTPEQFEFVTHRVVAPMLRASTAKIEYLDAGYVQADGVQADSLRVNGPAGYGNIEIDSDALWFDTDVATFAFNRPLVVHRNFSHTEFAQLDFFQDAGAWLFKVQPTAGGGMAGLSLQGNPLWLTDGGGGAKWTFSGEGARVAPTGNNRLTVDKELWVNDGGAHYIQLKVSAGPQIITDNNYLEFKANSGGAYADFSLNSEGLLVQVTGSTTSNHNVQLREKLFVTNSDGTWALSMWADSTKSYIATNAPFSGKIIQLQADTLEVVEGGRTHKIQGTSEGLTILSAGNAHTTIRNDLYIYDGTNTARLASKSAEALRVRHPSSSYYFDIENHSEGTTLDVTASSNNKHLTIKAADYYLYDAGSNYSVLTSETNGFKIQPRGSNYVKIVEGSNYVQFLPNSGGVQIDATTGGAEALYFTGKIINIGNAAAEYRVNNTKVVSARRTGWTAWTGTAARGSIATGSATLTNVAEAVKALIDDLITHGLIGA